MIRQIKKRDGRIESFDQEKIKNAIWKAAKAVGGTNEAIAEDLADQVVEIISERYTDAIPEVEDIQDAVEKVLIENGHAKTAKAYILYREKRRATREINAMIGATIDMFAELRPGVLHQEILALQGLPRGRAPGPRIRRRPYPRSRLLRPLLRGLGPAAAVDGRLRRRGGQGGE